MAELVELKCPNCAGRLDWTGGAKAVCPHCGTQFLVPSEVAERLACPQCGQVDRVQKVSAAYRGGQTVLSPPVEPLLAATPGSLESLFTGCGYVWLSLMGPGLLLVGLIGLSNPDNFLFVLTAIVGLGFTLLLVADLRRRPRAMRQRVADRERWEKATNRWVQLYYCARDDGVFIPGETSFIPIDKMQAFLYAD